MNPMMGGMSFPWGGGGNKLPSNPNPLAKPAPSHTVKADASGIQQAMAKRALEIPPELFKSVQEKYDGYANAGKGARMGMLSGLGTGVGGLLGGIHGLARDPGENEEGEPRSRLMNALKGTLGGAALGGVGGAAGSAMLNGVPSLGKAAAQALDPKFLKLLQRQLGEGPFSPDARFVDHGDDLDLIETIMEYEAENDGELDDDELGFYESKPDESGFFGVRPDLTYGQIQEGLQSKLKPKAIPVNQAMAKRAARCWEGYEPVPGKEPYSDDSCRPKGSKKKKQEMAKRANIARESLPFTLGGAALGGISGAAYNKLRGEDNKRSMWRDVLTGAGAGAGAGFASNLAGNATYDNDVGLRLGLGVNGDRILAQLAAAGGGIGGAAIGGGLVEGGVTEALTGGVDDEEKEAGAIGGAVSGGLGGGLLGAAVGGLGNLGYQAYQHYKPGLAAARDLERSPLPNFMKDQLRSAGKSLYPDFKPDTAGAAGFAGTGAMLGGGLGALLGGLDGHDAAKAKSKQKEQEQMLRHLYMMQQMQGMKSAAQDCDKPRLSSAGDASGVSYKIDDEGSLTGADAFKTLDGYMKKAGLNSFQSQFFTALIKKGMDEQQIRGVVKAANARFGNTIGDELTVGLEKIAVVWPVLKAIGQGVARAGSKIRPGAAWNSVKNTASAANQGVATASNAAWNLPGAAKKVLTDSAAKASNTGLAKGIASNPYAQHTGRAIKNTVTDPNQLTHTGLGALTGAVNPYTGAFSEGAYNGDGSYNWQNVARSTLAGAGLGRVSGAMGNRMGSQFGRDMMTRGLAGESIGAAAGGLGGLAGFDTDASQGARLGFGAGAGSRLVPGLHSKRVGNLIDNVDPNQMAVRAAKAALPWAKKNPRDAMLGVGGGGGALLASGAAANTAMNLQRDIPVLVNEKINTLGTELSNKVDDYAQDIVPQAQQTMTDLSEASRGVNNLTGGSNGNWMNALFGGGESGGSGMLGGMMGGVGDYVQKNPWLIPLLLSGLGAGGGYAMGGGGGAALGGVAAPLLYMLATGQMGNQNQQFGQNNAAANAEIQRQANENAKVTQDMQDPVTQVQQPQGEPINEIQRQQQQQLAGAQG
jgi:hypothetical protein